MSWRSAFRCTVCIPCSKLCVRSIAISGRGVHLWSVVQHSVWNVALLKVFVFYLSIPQQSPELGHVHRSLNLGQTVHNYGASSSVLAFVCCNCCESECQWATNFAINLIYGESFLREGKETVSYCANFNKYTEMTVCKLWRIHIYV
jgi:hypothetical protein